ncbi:MAG: ubiquinol-cytochrome c reductase iron-sulfur subunit [Acidimicrobiia bacterium]|nr:ubiquinol-cytochrome c reductase iron-sulfur subunit [Acidimicrobiia bacterium]
MDNGDPTGPKQGDLSRAEPIDPTDPDRRRFMVKTISVIGAGVAATVGVPAAIFVTGPTRVSGTVDEWIRLGSVSSVEPGGEPTLMKAVVERRSGYRVEQQEVSVFVTTDDGQEFRVLSNVCSHLGCRVRWVDDEDGFFCPCHNAVFGAAGEVVRGPPPRALDQYEAMVEDGQIFFKFKEV